MTASVKYGLCLTALIALAGNVQGLELGLGLESSVVPQPRSTGNAEQRVFGISLSGEFDLGPQAVIGGRLAEFGAMEARLRTRDEDQSSHEMLLADIHALYLLPTVVSGLRFGVGGLVGYRGSSSSITNDLGGSTYRHQETSRGLDVSLLSRISLRLTQRLSGNFDMSVPILQLADFKSDYSGIRFDYSYLSLGTGEPEFRVGIGIGL